MEKETKKPAPAPKKLVKRALCNVVAITAVAAIFMSKAIETTANEDAPVVAAMAHSLP